MDELHEQIGMEIYERTLETLKVLCNIWHSSYKEETISKYLKRLPQHVVELYNDITEEAEITRDGHVSECESLLKKTGEVCKMLSEPLPAEAYQKLPYSDAILALKNKLNYFNELLEQRTNEITSLLVKEKQLCEDLGMIRKGLKDSPLPSAKELDEFQKYLSELDSEKHNRLRTLEHIRADMARIFDELEIKPSLESEVAIIGGSKIKLSEANLKHISQLHTQYLEKLEESKTSALELREKLSQLWERLEEDPIIRNEFLKKHPGYGRKTVFALREEIAKCEQRKRDNIQVFVEKIRAEIQHWSEECMLSRNEKSEFTGFSSDYYTEDLLTLHELHLEKLQQFYFDNVKIFELVKKRRSLWKKIVELETRANDPNRYNNRGGQLLREEKERKKIASQLPKVEEDLISLSREYNRTTGKVFTVYGDSIEVVIENKHMEHKIDKQCQLSARKQARAVTPVMATTATKLFSNTKTSANLFGTPISNNISKRKRSPVYTPKIASKKKFTLNVENVDPHADIVMPSTSGLKREVKKTVLSLNKGGSGIKRRSGQRRKSNSKMQKTLAKTGTEVLNASKTYANFKTHLAKNAHLRSSIAPSKQGVTASTKFAKPIITLSAPTPPCTAMPKSLTQSRTPNRVVRQNTFSGSVNIQTPRRLTRSSSVMSPGSICGKLTTKNLPIII